MDDTSNPLSSASSVKTDRFLWLKILLSGMLLFFLLEHAAIATGNINYVPSLLAVGTFTVPVAFVAFLYSRDRTPHVSAASLLASLIWGGVVGTVLAGILEYGTLVHLGTLPTVMIGLIEEAAKLVVPAFLILGSRRRSETDSIVIGAASGAGFAALESMGYGLVALLASGGSLTATTQIILFRALLAPAAHIAWSALAANALWRLNQGKYRTGMWQFAYTFLGVVVLHALWDGLAIWGDVTFIVLGLISLSWLLLRVWRTAGKVDARA